MLQESVRELTSEVAGLSHLISYLTTLYIIVYFYIV